MKEWKNQIANKLNEKAKAEKEISFYETAKECGFNHVKKQEVMEITRQFLKENPTYKAIQFVKNPEKGASSTESLFTTLMLTECEYETEADFLKQ